MSPLYLVVSVEILSFVLPCINKIVRPPPLLSLAFDIVKFCAPNKKMLDAALYIGRCVRSSQPPRPPLRLKLEHARLDKG